MTASLCPIRLREALRIARAAHASDVHFSADMPFTLRVDGVLDIQNGTIISSDEIDEIVAHCFEEPERRRLQRAGDATTAFEEAGAGVVRIHAYLARRRNALAVRMLAEEIPALESLDLPPVVADLVQRKHGLVILSGPTGSGKSTALAAMVDRVNRTAAKHIITIEEPVEYRHVARRSIISQREVGADAESFSSALIGALRSDPDIILLGEMRDRMTMGAALTAAETGHLVFGTMHTGNAAEGIDRIVGSFEGAAQDEARTQLGEVLAAVVCLRLVRRNGRPGRRVAAEVLLASDAVRSAIRESKSHHLRNIIATSRSSGMQTLEAHLNDLVVRGEITYEAACQATDRRAELRTAESCT